MKKLALLIVGLIVFSPLSYAFGKKKADLSSDKAKLSYAIGQQIGRQLKGDNLDLDSEALSASLDDALAGRESKMKPEEIQSTMMKAREMQMAKMEAGGKENREKGEKFLADNKSKPGVKTTASGLQILQQQEGKGKSPKATDMVTVHYKGTLIDGTQFDSSYDRGKPADFPLNGVIKGWTEGLQLIKTGGKARLFIPSDLAYGPQGRPGIPPNSTLIFDVELVAIGKSSK